MKKITTLDKININTTAKIIDIDNNSKLKNRMQSLGITPNNYIKCEFKSPFNNPRAYLIKGCTIAIRNEDAKDVKVIIDE